MLYMDILFILTIPIEDNARPIRTLYILTHGSDWLSFDYELINSTRQMYDCNILFYKDFYERFSCSAFVCFAYFVFVGFFCVCINGSFTGTSLEA